MKIKEKVIRILRTIVAKYDAKQPTFMCDLPDTRNRFKNDKYKIPRDKPQCPIFKDNRCCGDCILVKECDHAVDCGCFGYAYAQLGGTDKKYYMRKASSYYEDGRIKEDGEYDWDYYKSKQKTRRKDNEING